MPVTRRRSILGGSLVRLGLGLLAAAGSRPGAAEENWRVSETPHFTVHYAEKMPPAGMTLDLEKLHNRLLLELGMIAPWLEEKRIQVYLYPDAAAFHGGRFQPPGWSNGISFSDQYTLATFVQDRDKMIRILSHESTHLLFEGYFRQGRPGRSVHASTAAADDPHEPPLWLDEGLAMLMEDPVSFTSDAEKTNVWTSAMRAQQAYLPLKDFFGRGVASEKDPGKVAAWYVQAYSLTRFLFRERPRGLFKTFCMRLRDGWALEAALRSAYGYSGLDSWQAAWRRWLKLPDAGQGEGVPAAGGKVFVPVSFSSPTFPVR